MPLVFRNGALLFDDGKLAFARSAEEACNCCGATCLYFLRLDVSLDTPLVPGRCLNQQFGLRTITIPESVPLPCWLDIEGDVDDEIFINGAPVDPPGTWKSNAPYAAGAACNHAHYMNRRLRVVESGEGDIVGRTFTISGNENFGRPSYYRITLCFTDAPCQGCLGTGWRMLYESYFTNVPPRPDGTWNYRPPRIPFSQANTGCNFYTSLSIFQDAPPSLYWPDCTLRYSVALDWFGVPGHASAGVYAHEPDDTHYPLLTHSPYPWASCPGGYRVTLLRSYDENWSDPSRTVAVCPGVYQGNRVDYSFPVEAFCPARR